jgi:pilus assembly protein CpaC
MNRLQKNLGPLLLLLIIVAGIVPACRAAAAPQAAAQAVASAAIVASPGNPPGSAMAASALASPQNAGALLPMVVGRSMFLNTMARLTRVYVSNPAVLDSYTSDPRQIVITAKAPGASSLVLWDDTGRSQAWLIVASTDVDALRVAIKQAFPLDNINVEAEQDNVSLSGKMRDQASIDSAVKMAGVYSKNVVNALLLAPPHLAQVRLRVRIVEIDRSKLNQWGLNFFSGGNNASGATTGQFPVSTSVTGGSTAGTTLSVSDPLNFFLFNNNLNVGVTIKDLESKQILQILAEPTITTLSGEKASFLSGGEFPFPVIQGSSGAGGAVSVTIQFRPYGVKLDFTPTVNPDGSILLKVAPEVSALDFTNAVTISGYTIPALSTRRADTQVELLDGQSFAISGLLDHRTTDILNKVPIAGNLPVIGTLFRSWSVTRSVVELVVVVTANIVDPLSHPADAIVPTPPKFVIPQLDNKEFDDKFQRAVKPYPVDPPANPPY